VGVLGAYSGMAGEGHSASSGGPGFITVADCSFIARGRAKALYSRADGDGARGCRFPLGSIVTVLLTLSMFRVKSFVRFMGHGDGDALCHFPS
jgi:hypothetical protein